MGFWQAIGEMAEEYVETMQKKQANVLHYKELARRYDDQTLIKKYKSSRGDEKIGYGMELKERGYGSEN